MGKRILIVNVNWIGDVLFTTPFIRAARESYPDGYIACLLHPRCKDMLEGNLRLDEIITYDEEGAHKSTIGKIKLIMELRKRHFDIAFILHRSFTKALIAYLAGIPERVGYPTKDRRMLLTKSIEEPIEEVHKVEYFLNLARGYGMKSSDRSYEFFIKDSDRTYIKGFLADNGVAEKDSLVAICPGGNWDPKRWPKENFAKICDCLAEKFGVKIVITGAKKETGLAEDIRKEMKAPAIIAAGRTTLKELGALLERANLVIANDTGSMHIAVAVKAKVIALFGPTSPEITGPYGKGNYRVIFNNASCDVPCYDVICKENRCMLAIKTDDVLLMAEELLKK